MRLRAVVVGFAVVLCGFIPCFAQQASGPRTLETLLKDDSAVSTQRPVAIDATAPAAATPLPSGRIQGAVSRPKDGVQHPDLDRAWAEYDQQIEAAAKAVEQAIEKGLNAAAASGDLDAALKWKTAGEQFQKDGQIPEVLDGPKPQGRPKPRPTKSEPSPQSLVAEAQVRLAKAYEAVEKELVKSLDLERAKQVRAERESLAPAGDNSAPAPLMVVVEARHYKEASPNAAPQRDGTGVAIREAARWDNLTIPADSTLLWDVVLPQQGNFFVHVLYASGEARPCDVSINGKVVARNVLGGNTGGFMRRNLKWETLGPVAFGLNNQLTIDPQSQSPHLSRIVISSDRGIPSLEEDKLMGSWAAGTDDPYLRVVEPQGRVREFDRRTGKELSAGTLRRLDDGRYEAVMSNGFTVYWRLVASDRAEFHAMDRAGKMQDKVMLKKQR